MLRLGTALVIVAASLAGCAAPHEPLPLLGPAPDFDGGDAWLGSDPLSLDDLKGQVVLVDFWTYSCINCIRTLPHVTGWYDTYRDDGFVTIGVHTPEFDFEEETANVEDAIARFAIHYPVVQDNDRAIWNRYENHYWPAKYLIDAQGRLRYTHFGEGDYAETEDHIRDLLEEAGQGGLPDRFEGSARQAQAGSGVTREIYAGTGRNPNDLGNAEGYHPGQDVAYTLPASREKHRFYLDGTWHNGGEALTAQGSGTVSLRFRAGAANFVADGHEGDCIPVRLDGGPVPEDLAGADVQTLPGGTCIPLSDTPRSYDFYAGPVEDHEVQFDVTAGFSLYTFAFSSYPGGTTP